MLLLHHRKRHYKRYELEAKHLSLLAGGGGRVCESGYDRWRAYLTVVVMFLNTITMKIEGNDSGELQS